LRDHAGVASQRGYIQAEHKVFLVQHVSPPDSDLPVPARRAEGEAQVDEVDVVILEVRVQILLEKIAVDIAVLQPGDPNQVVGECEVILEVRADRPLGRIRQWLSREILRAVAGSAG